MTDLLNFQKRQIVGSPMAGAYLIKMTNIAGIPRVTMWNSL